VPALIVLVGLGTWQLDRLAWKTELLATIGSRISTPAIEMPTQIDDPSEWNYRRVHVSGQFPSDQVLRLASRVYDGQVGDELIMPFVRDGNDSAGQIVLIDRGWVPDQWEGVIDTQITEITGVLRAPVAAGWFQPDNDPATNTWFTINLPEMAAATGSSDVFPMMLYQDAGLSDTLPIGGQLQIAVANDHLSYALTWYGLAAVLLVIYSLFHLRRPEDTT